MWQRFLKLFQPAENFDALVGSINDLESKFESLKADELLAYSHSLGEKVKSGETRLDDVMSEAFALVREASKRTLKQRHFDVQLIGGAALHQGKIAEMMTGEGKTLVATLPAYLNALTGKGAHIVTVNDYLARRDAVWMGQIYNALGLSVACLTHDSAFLYDQSYKSAEFKEDDERDVLGGFKVFQEFLRPVTRREAYLADITYGTNHEFGFDYLRDNLAYRPADQVQAGRRHYAIIDEADSILIDEARTPLIIAAPDRESSEYYKTFSRIVERLEPEIDYLVEEKRKSVNITDNGIAKTEKMIGVENLFDAANLRLVHFLQESLKAKALFRRDRDYVVKNNEIIIVDEFTGRLLPGRRYSGGLHQAIEAKEGVLVQQENRTFAQITIQNYFRLYEKISGMTGTAQTSAEEFHKVYNLNVFTVPPNKPMARKNMPDLIFKNRQGKYSALVEEVKKLNKAGQPVLLGTASIEKNEILHGLFESAGIPHEVLNAKNHEREGAIIAQAGRFGAVTVATNLAGRGVDIILGGNPFNPLEAQKVKELGGLHVIGTERHEARRIDNQLRGRSGRQGDPGSSQFFLSLDDDLLRIFGGERLQSLMTTFNFPEDMPIESRVVSKSINQAQSKVEGLNFDLRKHLLDYDDVLNKQRSAVYAERQSILEGIEKKSLESFLKTGVENYSDDFVNAVSIQSEVAEWPFEEIKNILEAAKLVKNAAEFDILKDELLKDYYEPAKEKLRSFVKSAVDKKLAGSFSASIQEFIGLRLLRSLDMFWMEHLENLEALQESVRIRAYGQHDPLVEYRREAHKLYKIMMKNFESVIFIGSLQAVGESGLAIESAPFLTENQPFANSAISKINVMNGRKIGRNDPCHCGSGKKYKKCHGK
ncbi:MAG: preprotein translocase subunit SecA [Candidatus Brennerbacteria bacterium]|nr:preprotein translocase subunit SecA [Candidatus Brennerbacteria bacterium]